MGNKIELSSQGFSIFIQSSVVSFDPIQRHDHILNEPSIPDPRIDQIDDQALDSYIDLGPYIWEELSSKSWGFISFTWLFAVSFNPIQECDRPPNKPSIPDPRIDQTTCR